MLIDKCINQIEASLKEENNASALLLADIHTQIFMNTAIIKDELRAESYIEANSLDDENIYTDIAICINNLNKSKHKASVLFLQEFCSMIYKKGTQLDLIESREKSNEKIDNL